MLALLFACKFDEHFVTLFPVCSGFPQGCYQFHSVAFFVHLSCTLNSSLVFLRQLQKAAASCQNFPGQSLTSLQPSLGFNLVQKKKIIISILLPSSSSCELVLVAVSQGIECRASALHLFQDACEVITAPHCCTTGKLCPRGMMQGFPCNTFFFSQRIQKLVSQWYSCRNKYCYSTPKRWK